MCRMRLREKEWWSISVIHKLDYLTVDRDQLERESAICDYVPINRVTLRRLKMDKSNSSYGSNFSDYLDK